MSFTHHHDVLKDGFTGGLVNWRVRIVHWAARLAGLLVHIEGFPYGSSRNIDRNKCSHETTSDKWNDLTQ